MIRQKIVQFLRTKRMEQKKRRANAELEASIAHRLNLRPQPRDARGRYMRTGGRATWKNQNTV